MLITTEGRYSAGFEELELLPLPLEPLELPELPGVAMKKNS